VLDLSFTADSSLKVSVATKNCYKLQIRILCQGFVICHLLATPQFQATFVFSQLRVASVLHTGQAMGGAEAQVRRCAGAQMRVIGQEPARYLPTTQLRGPKELET